MDDDKLNDTIKGLEKLIADDWIWKHADCYASLCSDALELLKESAEDVKPFHKCIGNEYTLIEESHFDYCPYCGKKVFWE